MDDAEKIVTFIREWFDELSINYRQYFYYNPYDPDEDEFFDAEWVEIQWIKKDGTLDMKAVSYASEVLGISVKDILQTNEEAGMKWLRKYPYLTYVRPFEVAYENTFYGKGVEARRLIEALFGKQPDLKYPPRYDYRDVTRRLYDQLKEFDKVLPGTVHPNANITRLLISTENFCRFEHIREMTKSFITMIKRATELFLKALQTELPTEEINEYNLLVSVLGLQDRWLGRKYLYYSTLQKGRKVYQNIDHQDLNRYLAFGRAREFRPWRCADFVDDESLVKEYLAVMPESKGEMRKFAMLASRFLCSFMWSDEEPRWNPEEEKDRDSFWEPKTPGSLPKAYTEIYVEKTPEELGSNDVTAKKLLRYCKPAKQGGIKVLAMGKRLDHMTEMLGKVPENNYMDRIEGAFSGKEGETDE